MHEVACWLIFEREAGNFPARAYTNWEGLPKIWVTTQYLGGTCAVAAYILALALRARGVPAGVVSAARAGHYWVETACGWHLDPTHMQFSPFKGPLIRRATKAQKLGMGLTIDAMMNTAKKKDLEHPCWPNYHTAVINRILRRMGVGP
jgi:hypothetical protein